MGEGEGLRGNCRGLDFLAGDDNGDLDGGFGAESLDGVGELLAFEGSLFVDGLNMSVLLFELKIILDVHWARSSARVSYTSPGSRRLSVSSPWSYGRQIEYPSLRWGERTEALCSMTTSLCRPLCAERCAA